MTPLEEMKQTEPENLDRLSAEVDVDSMSSEEYRRYLRSEMQKNDPRRTTPRRW